MKRRRICYRYSSSPSSTWQRSLSLPARWSAASNQEFAARPPPSPHTCSLRGTRVLPALRRVCASPSRAERCFVAPVLSGSGNVQCCPSLWQPYQGGEVSDGRRIYVGNINYEFREDEVRNAFTEVRRQLGSAGRRAPHCHAHGMLSVLCPLSWQFGQITSMSYKQGFAFIDYADKRDAEDAIASMNGKQLAGRTITVELSGRPPKQERDDRGFDRGRGDDYRADPRGSFGGTGGGNSRSQGSSDTATRNLFVANIPETLSEADVEHHFNKCVKAPRPTRAARGSRARSWRRPNCSLSP